MFQGLLAPLEGWPTFDHGAAQALHRRLVRPNHLLRQHRFARVAWAKPS
jgi:hypothetical protein